MEAVTPKPPVNEVVLSVFFEPQASLVGPTLSSVLGEWFEDHSRVQLASPYDSEVQRRQFTTGQPSIRIIDFTPQPRYFFVSNDDREVIQAQTNYLALGWRRKDPDEQYVRFRSLKSRFTALLSVVSDAVGLRGDELRPTSAEISYTNVIEPNSAWSNLGEVHKLLSVPVPQGEYEQASISYTKAITSDGAFVGRLFVSIQPVADWVKDEVRINLSITAKSAELGSSSIDEAIAFLDAGHEAANEAFYALLSDASRQVWGSK